MVLIRITSIQKNWLNRNGGMRMEELISSLNAIPNSYFEFIDSVVDYAERKEEHRILIMNFINSIFFLNIRIRVSFYLSNFFLKPNSSLIILKQKVERNS